MLDYFCFATQKHALKPNALCDVIKRPDASPRLVKRPLVGHLFRLLRPLHKMYYFYPLPHGMNKKRCDVFVQGCKQRANLCCFQQFLKLCLNFWDIFVSKFTELYFFLSSSLVPASARGIQIYATAFPASVI